MSSFEHPMCAMKTEDFLAQRENVHLCEGQARADMFSLQFSEGMKQMNSTGLSDKAIAERQQQGTETYHLVLRGQKIYHAQLLAEEEKGFIVF